MKRETLPIILALSCTIAFFGLLVMASRKATREAVAEAEARTLRNLDAYRMEATITVKPSPTPVKIVVNGWKLTYHIEEEVAGGVMKHATQTVGETNR